MAESVYPDPEQLRRLATAQMPFGKYAGRLLVDLPEPYVVWLVSNRLPDGTLGRQLLEIYEIKVNGLEALLQPFIRQENE